MSNNKYLREIDSHKVAGTNQIDVYSVLNAFNVNSHALGHAIKKLLCAGIRGKGDELQDLTEAVQAIERHIDDLKSADSALEELKEVAIDLEEDLKAVATVEVSKTLQDIDFKNRREWIESNYSESHIKIRNDFVYEDLLGGYYYTTYQDGTSAVYVINEGVTWYNSKTFESIADINNELTKMLSEEKTELEAKTLQDTDFENDDKWTKSSYKKDEFLNRSEDWIFIDELGGYYLRLYRHGLFASDYVFVIKDDVVWSYEVGLGLARVNDIRKELAEMLK